MNLKRIAAIMTGVCFCTFSSGWSQTSHYWLPDKDESRVDKGKKGAPTSSPLVKPKVKLTKVPSDKNDWKVTDKFITKWQKNIGASFDIQLEIEPQNYQGRWQPGGLLYVENDKTGTDGAWCLIAVTPENGIVFNSNLDSKTGQSHKFNESEAVTLPVVVRLERKNKTVTGYFKTTAAGNWVKIGSSKSNLKKPADPGVAEMLFEPDDSDPGRIYSKAPWPPNPVTKEFEIPIEREEDY